MFKRVFISTVTLFLLAASAWTPQAAYAQTTNSQPNNEVTRLILSGLWQGVNFNFAPATIAPSAPTSNNPIHKPHPTPPTAGAYVAMGDSVAAGVGLGSPASVPSSEVRCGRNTQAYPYSVAERTGLPLVHIACSGATTRDLYTRDWLPAPSLPAQISTAFSSGTPRLISITSGANDIRWQEFLSVCNVRNCATAANTAAITGWLQLLEARIGRALSSIQSSAGNAPPWVIVTGYYNPVSPACIGVKASITPAEINWISDNVTRINQAIQNAVGRYYFARYAPVDFTGHDVCSADPWIQGLQSPRPFHPNVRGQQIIGQSVVSTYVGQ